MPEAYDIESFCKAHFISRSTFYNLLNEGRGPKLMHIGRRVVISTEAAHEWRRQMEAPAKSKEAS